MLKSVVNKFGIPLMEDERDPVMSFLPEKLVMIDCEMSGVVPKRDDLLQVAMIKLKLDGNQYSIEGEPLVIYLKSNKKPSNDFHEKYLKDIFKKANESETTPEMAKEQIEQWLGDYKKAVPTGDAIQCDMAFLLEKGLVEPNDIVNEGNIGTFHYEQFDINPIKCVARTKIGEKEDKKFLDLEDGIHDALVDCRNQIKELNYFLSIVI